MRWLRSLPDSEMIKDDTDKLSSSYKVLERLCLKTLLGGALSSLKQLVFRLHSGIKGGRLNAFGCESLALASVLTVSA